MVLLTDALGGAVLDPGGSKVGRVTDLLVSIDDDRPPVVAVEVRDRRRPPIRMPWGLVASFDDAGVMLRCSLPERSEAARPGLLALADDVLDTQIVDLAGRRLTRVGDVELDLGPDGALRVVAVETGLESVLHRIGLGRLVRRASAKTVDWTQLRFVSGRAPELMLESRPDRIAGLDAAGLAQVLARVPPEHGAVVLRAATPETAARALGLGRPQLGSDLLVRLDPAEAGPLVERMPEDDAVAVLRNLGIDAREPLLRALSPERASELRRLLAFAPATAAGLMTTDVRVARSGEDAATITQELLARPPRLQSLQTVFVTDAEGRPAGIISPLELLAGRVSPIPVAAVAQDAPLDEIVDRFALEDVLALPVVDGEGRLVGAVAVDDVLEELLAERLPGKTKFRRHRILRRDRA